MSEDAARYRKQSDECGQKAERAEDPIEKLAWLQLAAEWHKLAEQAESLDK